MKLYSMCLRVAMVVGCMTMHYAVHASFFSFFRPAAKTVHNAQDESLGQTKSADIHSSYDRAMQILEKAMPDDCTRLMLGYLQELQVNSSCKKQTVEWVLPEREKLPVQALLPLIGLYTIPANQLKQGESCQDQCMIVSNAGQGYGTISFCCDAQRPEVATAHIVRPKAVLPKLAALVTLPDRMSPVCKHSSMKNGVLEFDQAGENNGERVGTVVTLSDGNFALSHYRSSTSKFELYHGNVAPCGVTWSHWGFLGNKAETMCSLSNQRLALVEQNDTGIACRVFSLRDKKFTLERTLPMPRYASTLKEYVLCQLPENRFAIGGDTGKVDIWNYNLEGKSHAESTITFQDTKAAALALKYMEHVAAGTLLLAHTQGFELWDVANNSRINAIQLDPEKYTIEQVFKIKKDRYFLVMKEREGHNTWKKISQIWTFEQGCSRVEQAYNKYVASRPKTPSPTNSPTKNSPTKK